MKGEAIIIKSWPCLTTIYVPLSYPNRLLFPVWPLKAFLKKKSQFLSSFQRQDEKWGEQFLAAEEALPVKKSGDRSRAGVQTRFFLCLKLYHFQCNFCHCHKERHEFDSIIILPFIAQYNACL